MSLPFRFFSVITIVGGIVGGFIVNSIKSRPEQSEYNLVLYQEDIYDNLLKALAESDQNYMEQYVSTLSYLNSIPLGSAGTILNNKDPLRDFNFELTVQTAEGEKIKIKTDPGPFPDPRLHVTPSKLIASYTETTQPLDPGDEAIMDKFLEKEGAITCSTSTTTYHTPDSQESVTYRTFEVDGDPVLTLVDIDGDEEIYSFNSEVFSEDTIRDGGAPGSGEYSMHPKFQEALEEIQCK